ncbi:MAG TPA: DUF4363 family protein [Syntrophomonadaceae bacterium]|nr:DUF4363 family protein [Syntrophomonadaceae bacterium]
MRLLTSLLIIFASIISFGFWMEHSLEVSTDELTKQIERVSNEVKKEEWVKAVIKMDEVEEKWQEETKWWPIFIDHLEIDNIEFSLAKTKEYIKSQDTALSRGQLSELKFMLEHIASKEKINLKNIL